MLQRSVRLLSAVAVAVLLSGLVGVGQAAAASGVKKTTDAKVSVVFVAKPAGEDANMLVYDLIAANHVGTYARNLVVTVPFNSAMFKLVDVKFSGEAAWMPNQSANALVYQIDGLHKNHPNTATVRFQRLTNAPADAVLKERATYVWSVQGRSHSAISNLPIMQKPYYPMDVSAFTSTEGVTQRFAANLFVPDEPVTFWCNMPDGTVHELLIRSGPTAVLEHKVSTDEKKAHSFVNAIRAGADGSMSIDFPADELTTGDYSIVAYGQWSGLSAVGPFTMK
jgi:hypothetical protein